MSKFEEYEQDYKQDKVRLVTTVQGLQGLSYGDKMGKKSSLDAMFQDDNDMLEMLESELGALTGSARAAAAARLSGYKSDSADLRERMQVELSAREADDRNTLFARGDRSGSVEMDPLFNNQRNKLAASSAKLNAARDEMRDTQDVAAGIMTQLEADREKIINIRKNTIQADESLSRSNAIMRRIRNADIKERIIMGVFGTVLVALIITAIYFMAAGGS